ncbi:hypothetical protein D3C72_828930 [compost metagenome]
MFRAGVQVPLIPLIELRGNAARAAPEQIGPTCVNTGVRIGFTTIVMVAGIAHCPADGVNV